MTMMKQAEIFDRFKILLGGVKYHPLVVIDIWQAAHGLTFKITYFAIDSRSPNDDIRVTAKEYAERVGPMIVRLPFIPIIHTVTLDYRHAEQLVRDSKHFLYWLKSEFMKLSHHEIDEFFQFNGELVNDPHKHDFPCKY